MKTVNVYLNFNGNTEEAFNFYRSVFGGDFTMLQRFKETSDGSKISESDGEKIMHVALPMGQGAVLMGTDALESMGQKLVIGNNFSITIEAENRDEAEKLFDGLSEGGKVEMPLGDTFWGAYFGMCTDKFGIQWMVNYTYTNEEELIIVRTFDAPRERVWDAWTNQEKVKEWWGPKDFTAPFASIDFRTGGKYLYCMRSPDGKDYWSTGIYHEIVPMKKIVSGDSFSDEKGNVVSASYYGMNASFPLELLITVEFEEQNDKTKMTLKHEGMPKGNDLKEARMGWNESLDKLAGILK